MKEITDPGLINQLENAKPVTDPKILEQLEGKKPKPETHSVTDGLSNAPLIFGNRLETILGAGSQVASGLTGIPSWAVGLQEKYSGKPYEGLLTKKLPIINKSIAELSQIVSGAIEKVGAPKSEESKKELDILNLPQKGLQKVGEFGGETVKKMGGSPSVSALTEAIPQIAPMAFGRGKGKELVEKGIEKTFPKPDVNAIIDKGIEKGIRPSVVGKGTYSKMENYAGKAREAVKIIIANKNNLKLTDEAGRTVSRLPENLKEFSQASEQTKRAIFQEYDAMAKQGAQPVKGTIGGKPFEAKFEVDLKPIAKELDVISKDKVLNDISPEVANYAKQRSRAFGSRGKYSSVETQDAIAHLNNSLDAFYKNPDYANASKASIDSMIANRMRKSLDSMIESAVGPGYQQLKNAYGAISQIEKDIVHRAGIDARKNIKGFFDFSDIFSGAEVVRGILTLNPASVGVGVAANRIKALIKHMNDPNNIVKKMFQQAEKAQNQGPRDVNLPPFALPPRQENKPEK